MDRARRGKVRYLMLVLCCGPLHFRQCHHRCHWCCGCGRREVRTCHWFVRVIGFERFAGVRRRALCVFCGCWLCLSVLAFLALVAVPGHSHRRSLRLADVEVGRVLVGFGSISALSRRPFSSSRSGGGDICEAIRSAKGEPGGGNGCCSP